MARKIVYEDKVISKIIEYLVESKTEFTKTPHVILVKAEASTHEKVFREIATMLSATRYGLQEDIKSFEIEIFNSSV